MPGPGLLVGAALVPALVAAFVLLVAWRPWRVAPARKDSWGPAAALGLGYLAGEYGSRGVPPFPPTEATQWIPYVVAFAAVASALLARPPVAPSVRWVLRGALAMASVGVVLRPLVTHTWNASHSVAWLVGLTVAALAARRVLRWAAPDTERGRGFLPIAALAGCAAAALASSGSLSLGLVAGSLAAAAAAGAVVSLFPGSAGGLAPAGLTPVWIALTLLLVAGASYSSLPWWSAALLAAAPAAARIVPSTRLAGRPWWIAEGLRAAAIAAVGVAAVAVAYFVSSAGASDHYY